MSAALSLSPSAPEPEKPSASVVYVTPDMARRWLTRNTKNRNLKPRKIEQYSRDMAAGRWLITGEAIKFSKSGHLLDGQNRLNAVIASGATVPMFVIRGIEDAAQNVMDTGAVRPASDALTISGYKHGKTLAATANVYANYCAGVFMHCMSGSNRANLTNAEVLDLVDKEPGLLSSSEFGDRFYTSLRMPKGALAVAHLKLSQIDNHWASEFFDRIAQLRTRGRGDAIHTLIKRVDDIHNQRQRMLPATALFMLFRAWNADRNYEDLTKFQFGSAERGWAQIPAPF